MNDLTNIADTLVTIKNNQIGLAKLIKLTKAKVLDLAIRGKLVPQDPTDEPASVLLERIKTEKKATAKPTRRAVKTNVTTSDISHCQLSLPNGWIEVDFDSVFYVIASKPYQILQSTIKQHGLYPVISQSSNYIEGYSDNDQNIYKVNKSVIIFGDHTRIVKLVDFDFIVGADGVKILQPLFYEKYAYLVMLYNSSITTNKGYSRHFQYLTKHKIFLPPLTEQKRIVAKVDEIFEQLYSIEKALME